MNRTIAMLRVVKDNLIAVSIIVIAFIIERLTHGNEDYKLIGLLSILAILGAMMFTTHSLSAYAQSMIFNTNYDSELGRRGMFDLQVILWAFVGMCLLPFAIISALMRFLDKKSEAIDYSDYNNEKNNAQRIAQDEARSQEILQKELREQEQRREQERQEDEFYKRAEARKEEMRVAQRVKVISGITIDLDKKDNVIPANCPTCGTKSHKKLHYCNSCKILFCGDCLRNIKKTSSFNLSCPQCGSSMSSNLVGSK